MVSVSVIGLPTRDERSLLTNVTGQLKRWFGNRAGKWKFLRMYQIEHAQPVVVPLEWRQPVRVEPGLYTAGDYRATPSIQGAMESGRLAAEALIRDMRGEPDPEPEAEERRAAKGKRVVRKVAAGEAAPEAGRDPDQEIPD